MAAMEFGTAAFFYALGLIGIAAGVLAKRNPGRLHRIVRPIAFNDRIAHWSVRAAPYAWMVGGSLLLGVITALVVR